MCLVFQVSNIRFQIFNFVFALKTWVQFWNKWRILIGHFNVLSSAFAVYQNESPLKNSMVQNVKLRYLYVFASVIISSSSLFFDSVFMGNLFIVFQYWPIYQTGYSDFFIEVSQQYMFQYEKRPFTDSKWVTRVPESRILFLVHSSSSAF